MCDCVKHQRHLFLLLMIVALAIVSVLFTNSVQATSGCCSWHGGVSGCDTSTGRQVCNDGTYSPSCGCQIVYIYGCTNRNALNYNAKANKDDGSCRMRVDGCTDKNALNYNASATNDNGGCTYKKVEVKDEPIVRQTVTREDSNMNAGEEKVDTMGEDGLKKVTYNVTTNKDGVEISREKVSEVIQSPPVDKIMIKGTKDNTWAWVLGGGIATVLGYGIYKGSKKKL